MTGEEGVHGRSCKLHLLVESYSVLAMHLDVVDSRACPLHLHDPILCQVRPHDGVFTSLQHKEGRLVIAYVANRPPLGVQCPGDIGVADLCRRCAARGTSYAARLLTPRVGVVIEGCALGCNASH